jgi:hypothetical protein
MVCDQIHHLATMRSSGGDMTPKSVMDSDVMARPTGRQKFSLSEDNALLELVGQNGACNWQEIASHMPGRTGRQCRDRFANYLAPTLTQQPWSRAEDDVIIKMFKQGGPRWSQIAACLPGRSSNSVKNRWNTHIHFMLDLYERPPASAQKRESEDARLTSADLFLAIILNPAPAQVAAPVCRSHWLK